MSSESNISDLIQLYNKVEKQKIDKERYYIKAKLENKMNDIIYHKNELKKLTNKTSKMNNVINTIERKLTQMQSNIDELKEPFLLSVVGPGKYGKSTLINALLESEQTKIDDLPKTWKIDIFYGSDNDNLVKIIKKDGSYIKKTREESNRLLIEEEEKRKESERSINLEIKNLKKEITDKKVLRDHKARLEKELLYESDISELQIPISYNKILKHFRLVDTPGINQTLLGDTQNRINEYYSRANGVLWMLDATSLASGANDKALNDIKDSLEKVGGNTENIVAVLNKVDEIESKYGKEKVVQVLEEAKQVYGKYFKNIVAISAKKAYDGIITNNKELIKQSNIDELTNMIQVKFQQKAQAVKLNSTTMNLNVMIKECSDLLNNYVKELETNENKRKEISDYVNSEINRHKQENKDRISEIVNLYIEDAKKRVDLNAQIVMDIDIEEEKKVYISENIIKINELIDMLKNYESSVSQSYKFIYNNLFEMSYFSEYEHIKINFSNTIRNKSSNLDELDKSEYNFNIEGTSMLSSVGVAAISSIFLGPIGIGLGFLAQSTKISSFIAKKIHLPKLKNNLKLAIDKGANDLKSNLENEVIGNLNQIQSKCDNVREKTFEDLYCKSNDYLSCIQKIYNINCSLNKDIEKITVEEIILDKIVV